MRKSIILAIFTSFCFVASYAQNCDSKLRQARDFESQKNYKGAAYYYKRVAEDCDDENARAKYIECNKKWKESQNTTSQKKSSSEYVPKQQTTGLVSNTKLYFDEDGENLNNTPNVQVVIDASWDYYLSEECQDWMSVYRSGNTLVVNCSRNSYSMERDGRINIIGEINKEIEVHQEGRRVSSKSNTRAQTNSAAPTFEEPLAPVKISFEAKKAVPTFENVGKLLGLLEDDKNLGLQIEISWCSEQKIEMGIFNKYPSRLMKKRIKNITNYFVNSGIAKERIAWSINESNTDCDSGYVKLKDINGESSK